MLRVGLVVLLVSGVSWLYAGIVGGLLEQWVTSPDAAYGAILAAVGLFLLWRDRTLLSTRSVSSFSSLGLIVVAGALAMFLAGFFAADLFTARASLVVLAGGLVWALCGSTAARSALTPLLFLLLAIPLPELVVTTLTSSLQTVAARSAELVLTAASVPVYREGNVLQLPSTTLQVVEACSGLRSVVSLFSVGVLLAWATPLRVRSRAVLIAATIPIAVLINGLRIAGTGAAAEAWGPALTRDPWHSLAGWLTFVLSLGALAATRRLLLYFGTAPESKAALEHAAVQGAAPSTLAEGLQP